ncbi:MAG: hypothetical protein GTO02_19085 [Candidatus Dadabacteria bacterium]|nr:hypothetical protein [Candidatus Dadabacteria bacterium]
MRNYSFKEYADFGLGIDKRPTEPQPKNQDYPLQPLNIEYIINSLKNKMFGEKYAIPNNFFGELQWGYQDGAIRLSFGPYGGTRAVLRKLSHNLEGDPVWICKKVIEVKDFYDETPDKLTFKIDESLSEMDHEGIDAPNQGFKGLERLAIRLASHLRRHTTQKIFMYEGIRVVRENENYIIHFGVTGAGRQRRGQKRLDKFYVQTEYSNQTGVIKIAGTELGDKISQHRWILDPSEFVEYFVPGQPEDEINDAVLALLNCF